MNKFKISTLLFFIFLSFKSFAYDLTDVQMNYDFTATYYPATSGGPGGGFSATFSGINGNLTSVSNVIFQGNSVINTNPGSGGFGTYSTLYYGTFDMSSGNLTNLGLSFLYPTNPTRSVQIYTCYGNVGVGCDYSASLYVITHNPPDTNYGFLTTDYTGNPAVGAPEIDGSLAPKVGFLLGCLFLIFGRKRDIQLHMLNLEYTAKIKG